MRVQLLVTRTDFSLPNLINECQDLGIEYEVAYVEKNPDLVREMNIRHSPSVIIDGKLAFRRQPSESELRDYVIDHEFTMH